MSITQTRSMRTSSPGVLHPTGTVDDKLNPPCVTSPARHRFYQHEAAKLDPRAFVQYQTATGLVLTVPSNGWWVYNSFFISAQDTPVPGANTSHWGNHRNCGVPAFLPGGTVITMVNGQTGFLYACQPELVIANDEYSDPETLFYNRRMLLASMGPRIDLSGVVPAGAAANVQVDVALTAPAGVTYGMLLSVSAMDLSWIGLFNGGGTHALNLMDEISDNHKLRFTAGMMMPFTFSDWTIFRCKQGSTSGNGVDTQTGGANDNSGHGVMSYVPLTAAYLNGVVP